MKKPRWEKLIRNIIDKIIEDCVYPNGYIDYEKETEKIIQIVQTTIKERKT